MLDFLTEKDEEIWLPLKTKYHEISVLLAVTDEILTSIIITSRSYASNNAGAGI